MRTKALFIAPFLVTSTIAHAEAPATISGFYKIALERDGATTEAILVLKEGTELQGTFTIPGASTSVITNVLRSGPTLEFRTIAALPEQESQELAILGMFSEDKATGAREFKGDVIEAGSSAAKVLGTELRPAKKCIARINGAPLYLVRQQIGERMFDDLLTLKHDSIQVDAGGSLSVPGVFTSVIRDASFNPLTSTLDFKIDATENRQSFEVHYNARKMHGPQNHAGFKGTASLKDGSLLGDFTTHPLAEAGRNECVYE